MENSIEKDRNNIIEELTKVRTDKLSKEGLKLFNKINEIIDENERLEEENRIYGLEACRVRLKMYIDKNYLQKSLVKEKIEELNKLITEAQKELGSASKEYTIYVYQKDILQELLEKR